jgi:hypothetical protein
MVLIVQAEAEGMGLKARKFPQRGNLLSPRLALLFEEPCPLDSG